MLAQSHSTAWRWLATLPFTTAFGIGRSLVALGILITLSIDGTDVLFAPDESRFPLGRCGTGGILDSAFFCVFGFETGRWLGILIALLVVLGITPALTAIPFAYVAWSLQATIAIPEGGDQLASNLAMIMVPLSLLDWRLTQWNTPHKLLTHRFHAGPFASSVRVTCMVLLWLQMSIVYFFAAVEKFPVEEWKEGTAMYYWATDPNFGATGFRLVILEFLTTNPFFVVALTWGTLLLELLLAAGWMATPKVKKWLLIAGIVFHGGIAVFMGLISFVLIMFGGLMLYLGTGVFHPRETVDGVDAQSGQLGSEMSSGETVESVERDLTPTQAH